MKYIIIMQANNQCTEELVGTHSLLFTFLNRFLKRHIGKHATLKIEEINSHLN